MSAPVPPGHEQPGELDPALPKVVRRVASRDDAVGELARLSVTSFPMRCLLRFVRMSGRDRVLALAGQAFTGLVPLAIVVAALGPHDDSVSDSLIRRFHLTGDSAQAVESLFRRPPDAAGTVTVVGILLLFFSLLSFTRALQRTYEVAWELPPAGLKGTIDGLSGVGMLFAQAIVLSLLASTLRGVPAATFVTFVLRVAVATVLWLQLQRLLLSRRVPRSTLVPGAVAAGVGQVVVSIYSATWMPRLISSNAERYGVIGVTFALLTWLIVIAAGVVATAVVSAEAGHEGRSSPPPERPLPRTSSSPDDDGPPA